MSASTMDNGDNPPKKNETPLRSCLALFAGIVITLFFFWLIFFLFIGPDLIRNSRNAEGYPFFKDMKTSLEERYGEAVVIRDAWPRLGRDHCFHVDLDTRGEDAPPPTEIAREIHQLKKQSEFMSQEVLIVTIDGDAEDRGIRFVFPGKNGYRGNHKTRLFAL